MTDNIEPDESWLEDGNNPDDTTSFEEDDNPEANVGPELTNREVQKLFEQEDKS